MSSIVAIVLAVVGLLLGGLVVKRASGLKVAKVEHESQVAHDKAVDKVTSEQQPKLDAVEAARANANSKSISDVLKDEIDRGEISR